MDNLLPGQLLWVKTITHHCGLTNIVISYYNCQQMQQGVHDSLETSLQRKFGANRQFISWTIASSKIQSQVWIEYQCLCLLQLEMFSKICVWLTRNPHWKKVSALVWVRNWLRKFLLNLGSAWFCLSEIAWIIGWKSRSKNHVQKWLSEC